MNTDETGPIRESFEKWAADRMMSLNRMDGFPDAYQWSSTHHAWASWQAAYAAGAKDERERAAKVCEQWAEQHRIDAKEAVDENCDFRMGAEACAAAIRRKP